MKSLRSYFKLAGDGAAIAAGLAGGRAEEGDFALVMAAKNGHTEMVTLLLAAGADVHVRDDLALWLAAKNGHAETVRVLEDWIAREGQKPSSPTMQPGIN